MNSKDIEADLHIHTHYSDGVMSPSEIIKIAQNKRLLALSVTDHDTVKGIDESIRLASKANLILIPGIELSTQYESSEIHMLSYFIDHNNKYLLNILDNLYKERLEIGEIIVNNLSLQGIKLNWNSIKSSAKESLGRPHIAREMVKRGYVKSISDAFENYLNDKNKLELPSKKLNSLEAIDIINQSGGVSVIAHPHTVQNIDNILPELSKAGLSGLEVYNARYSNNQKEAFIKLANNFGLSLTGGSDFHSNESNNKLGKSGITLDTVKIMMRKALNIHGEKVGWLDKRLLDND